MFSFSLILSIFGIVNFFLAAMLIPASLMRIFAKSEEFIGIGSSYLRIVSTSYLFTAISTAITGL